MAAQLKSFHLDSLSKNNSSSTSKKQNKSSEIREELLKEFIRKRTLSDKLKAMESKKPLNDSSKKALQISAAHNQHHNGKELLKVVRKGTEKLSIKESNNKCKLGTTHSMMCLCSPTTHKGSFKCHLHRISAAKKSTNDKNKVMRLNSKRTHGLIEFKPQLSRFGRLASAEFGSHHDGSA